MTLLEMMLAIAVMCLVGLGTTGMMSALTTGMAEQHDARSSMLRAGLSQARFSSYVSRCRCLLDLEETRLVLWLEDTDGDNTIDGTEVRWISWEVATGAVTIRWVADETGGILEDPYADPANVDWWSELAGLQQMAGLKSGSLTLVSGVAGWTFATDLLTSPYARRAEAMKRRTVEATYELDIAENRIEHCLGDSIRMHDPPDGGDS
jgi:hypothetical protein